MKARPSGAPTRPDRVAARGLWIVLALALALRVVYVLQSRASPLFASPQMDALYDLDWARAFAAGRELAPGEPFYRAPLYPWFLGAVLAAFGPGLLVPRILQALLGTATVALTYLVGARAFDRRTGLLAALGAALYPMLIYFDAELLDPPLAIPLNLLALWLSLGLAETSRPHERALAGAAWGLAALARPTVLLAIPLVAAWVAWRGSSLGRPRLAAAAAFLAGAAAPILPVTAYNALAAKDAVVIASTGGVNLWIGNNPDSDGTSALVPGARADLWGGIEDARRIAEAEAGRELRPSEVSRHYARKAWAFLLREPARSLPHLAWKLRLFWTDWELGNDSDPRFLARRYGPVLRWLPLSFGIVAALGLVGFALAAPRWRALFPLWAFVPLHTATIVLFFVNARFRLPIVPVLLVLGAHALVRGLEAFRARRWRPLALASLAAALLAWLAGRVPERLDTSDAQGLWILGVHALQRGEDAAALDLLREAVRENPGSYYAWRSLAVAERRTGRLDDALASCERALAIAPADAESLDVLAEIHLDRGDPGAAAQAASRAIAASPGYAGGHLDLGRALLDLGRPAEAAAALARAHALAPGEFAAAHLLGRALLELGRPADAAPAFDAARRALPDPDPGGFYWINLDGLVRSLARTGRADEAARIAASEVARFPAEPRARALAQAARPE